MGAKELAETFFSEYSYADHDDFGDNYLISNSQANFAAIMYKYCAAMNEGVVLPDTTADQNITSVPERKEVDRFMEMKVFPNPTSGMVNFELSTDVNGMISNVLYNYQGQTLMRNGIDSWDPDP